MSITNSALLRRYAFITHPDRLLFKHPDITKIDLMQYYYRVSQYMLVHLKDRLISMHRYPDGVFAQGFFQKNIPDYFPDWIPRYEISSVMSEKITVYTVCNTVQTLIYLTNQSVITPHIWLSSIKDLDHPDRMIFDFDPSRDDQFDLVCMVAKQCRFFLKEQGLDSFVMTTGSRGLHVVVPIRRLYTFDQVRAYADRIARRLVESMPDVVTTEVSKSKRKDKIFIDCMRNAWAQTSVAPYAVRAKSGAPIATPLFWKEVRPGLHPQKYTIKNIFRRLAKTGDPWAQMQTYAQTLAF